MNIRKPIWFIFLSGIVFIIWSSPVIFSPLKLILTELRLFWIGLLLGFLGGDFLNKQGIITETPNNLPETLENPPIKMENFIKTAEKPSNKGGRPKKTPKGFTVYNTITNEELGNFDTIESMTQYWKLRQIMNGKEPLAYKEIL